MSLSSGKRKAFFSLFDQENAVSYAKQLVALGWEIIASSETFSLLKEHNVPVKNISDFLEVRKSYPFPPTLHPSLELFLTTDQGDTVDFVYITNYPLSEGNDVGGHTILALAAKGKRIVVFNKEDMERVIKELQNSNNEIPDSLRQELINKAFTKIAKHYQSLLPDSKNMQGSKIIIGEKAMTLLEGENPYQVPCELFKTDDSDAMALPNFEQLCGELPCYTNMADFDSILQTLCLAAEAFCKYYQKVPYIVVAAKHGNPCGLAIDWEEPRLAVKNALLGNPSAIFGGEVITNFSINEKIAELLVFSVEREKLLGSPKWSLDLIIASDFDQTAIEILKSQKRLKIFKNNALTRPRLSKLNWSYRMVRGGFLRQPPNNYVLNFEEIDLEVSSAVSDSIDSLIIAWATAWSSAHGGNEVALAKNRMLLAAGGGPATIDSCRIAINRAKNCRHSLEGSVFASNAFFPFSDASEELVKAGCSYGIVPKGGRNFESVKNYFKEQNVKVFYLPKQFRGFCRH